MIDHTRRSWLVTIGGATAGLGIAARLQGEAKDAALPPGVYGPSADHLGHALMSAERFRPIPEGCPTDYLRPASGPFSAQYFSASDFAVIRRLTQLLLGEVPGDAGASHEVAEWIDLRVWSADGVREAATRIDPLHRALAIAYYGPSHVTRLERDDPAKTCREGLQWIAGMARQRHSGEFLSLGAEQQIAMLDSIGDARAGERTENAGTRFFVFLKAETIRGYYTSRAGLKELDFKGNAFYARSPGCGGKS